MNIRMLLIPVLIIGLQACSVTEGNILEEIKDLQERGMFSEAENRIKSYIQKHRESDASTIKQLQFEIERGNRIRYDYRLTEKKLYEQLIARFDTVSSEEFAEWQRMGWFDTLLIDGEKRFVGPSVSNLLFRHPDLKKRLKRYDPYSNMARVIDTHVKRLIELAAATPDPVLFPRTCQVRQTLTIASGNVPPGEMVRCWLPYPSIFETQGNVRYKTSGHRPVWTAAPGSPIRSIYFEAPMPPEGDLKFAVEYEYTAYAFYRRIDPENIIPFDETDQIYQVYTRQEYPHEVFSSEMLQLSREIAGEEQNLYLKGKRIYDWIADNIRYSYAREYSTLHNISAYCLDNKYGDCGQEAILFITLCRIAGIPARWQSGFMTFPGDEGMHDWAEIYLKPYGWLPVDPYMGIYFTSVTEDLDPATRSRLRDFYFGNIDHFRLVANKGHNQSLYPVKNHFRSETVDFQRGEVEWSGENLYFNKWDWSVTLSDISSDK